jgi:hypothetical protein
MIIRRANKVADEAAGLKMARVLHFQEVHCGGMTHRNSENGHRRTSDRYQGVRFFLFQICFNGAAVDQPRKETDGTTTSPPRYTASMGPRLINRGKPIELTRKYHIIQKLQWGRG